ncbi:DUF6635 family protein [Falsirhodobacter sp. 20TX0035]|uniref:DUF6635 family protein n=1 Tax=Falsirhodobacter sp. 20TX0035 TaxID=3022019 RepID=UPI00232C02BE|nr:DUF6635 family protein [Falsirhodobacter sp. 20TX0035]MDB6454291.1 hypothetical protein [Falsirhodobacter sp. 20TX0035]
MQTAQDRAAAVEAFTQRNFSLWGSMKLHRHAIGWDLLRAPANVALAPLFLLQKLAGVILGGLRLTRAARWITARPLMFRTALAAELDRRLYRDLLEPLGLIPQGAIDDYLATRNATNEIATTVGTLGFGAVTFKSLTPGVLSLAPALAAVMAQGAAVASFPLGGALGAVWYSAFPSKVPMSTVVLTGAALVLVLALMATFAGILTDPVQRRLGLHQNRLRRLVEALAAEREAPGTGRFTAPEHYVARSGDLADAAVNALRWFRG